MSEEETTNTEPQSADEETQSPVESVPSEQPVGGVFAESSDQDTSPPESSTEEEGNDSRLNDDVHEHVREQREEHDVPNSSTDRVEDQ